MYQRMSKKFSQDDYISLLGAQSQLNKHFFTKGLTAGERELFAKHMTRPNPRFDHEMAAIKMNEDERFQIAKKIMKNVLGYQGMDPNVRKAGISTTLGYNFYDLRSPVFFQFPVNTPLRNSLASEGPTNAGVGTAAHWKGTTDVGIQPISIPEGFRAPVRTPNEVDYMSLYKEFGVDSEMTFTAQWAGEGFTDNRADDHLRSLFALWLGEEGMILNGNCGTTSQGGSAGNGFAFGTANTPTTAQSTTSAGTLAAPTVVSVACVFINAMGFPSTNQYGWGANQTVTGGLIPSQRLQSAVGEAFTMPGGTSAISALSSPLTLTGGNNTVTATVTKKAGAVAFAWFVSVNSSPTLANSYLYSITSVPTATIIAAASAANQPGTAVGLNADNSFNTLEFTGLLGMVYNLNGLYSNGGWKNGTNWVDLGGASLTTNGHGKVNEIETQLENAFLNWQTGYTDIWGSPDAILALSQAVLASGTANTGYQIMLNNGPNGTIATGGNVVSGYLSRYAVDSPTGANVIPLRMHPMMPPGTLYFHLGKNPYPQSRIGNVLAAMIQRDYYSIEWPVTSRDWTWGTYRQYVLAHRLPWIPSVISGIGPYTGS